MPKNILILDTGHEWGGGTNSLLELLKRTDREKFRFFAAFYSNYPCGATSDIKSELEKLGVRFFLLERSAQPLPAKLFKETVRALMFFSRRTRRLGAFMADYRWRIQPAAARLAGLIRNHRIDLLYMNNQPSTNLEGLLAARMTGIPALQHARKVAELNFIERSLANRVLRRMICVSQGVREASVAEGIDESRCVVVYNGIDTTAAPTRPALDIRREYGISAQEILVGTAGSLIKLKRVDQLIDAMAVVIKNTTRPVKCLIVGDGPQKTELQALAKARGLEQICIFAGFQPDALSHINAMDLFVLSSSQEGLPRVILEAMLMGKPVVASNVTGSSELVVPEQTGFLFPFGRVDQLAEHIATLAGDRDLRSRMGEAARARVIENFSIERYVGGVEAVLEEALR